MPGTVPAIGRLRRTRPSYLDPVCRGPQAASCIPTLSFPLLFFFVFKLLCEQAAQPEGFVRVDGVDRRSKKKKLKKKSKFVTARSRRKAPGVDIAVALARACVVVSLSSLGPFAPPCSPRSIGVSFAAIFLISRRGIAPCLARVRAARLRRRRPRTAASPSRARRTGPRTATAMEEEPEEEEEEREEEWEEEQQQEGTLPMEERGSEERRSSSSRRSSRRSRRRTRRTRARWRRRGRTAEAGASGSRSRRHGRPREEDSTCRPSSCRTTRYDG